MRDEYYSSLPHPTAHGAQRHVKLYRSERGVARMLYPPWSYLTALGRSVSKPGSSRDVTITWTISASLIKQQRNTGEHTDVHNLRETRPPSGVHHQRRSPQSSRIATYDSGYDSLLSSASKLMSVGSRLGSVHVEMPHVYCVRCYCRVGRLGACEIVKYLIIRNFRRKKGI